MLHPKNAAVEDNAADETIAGLGVEGETVKVHCLEPSLGAKLTKCPAQSPTSTLPSVAMAADAE